MLEILSRAEIGNISPKRSQSIETSLLLPPYRTFINNLPSTTGTIEQQKQSHADAGTDADCDLMIYCLPNSVSEYIAFHHEASYVRSLLLHPNNKRCVVALYDTQSETILGGSVDSVHQAIVEVRTGTVDSIKSSITALKVAALHAMAELDQQVAQHMQHQQQQQEPNTVIVVGSGGREHALAVALAKSPLVDRVLCCPGNGGTQQEGGKISNQGVDQNNGTVLQLVKDTSATMVVVGPEGPLVDGLVDELAIACPGVRAFGPTMAAAELEASKVSEGHHLDSNLKLPCGIGGLLVRSYIG